MTLTPTSCEGRVQQFTADTTGETGEKILGIGMPADQKLTARERILKAGSTPVAICNSAKEAVRELWDPRRFYRCAFIIYRLIEIGINQKSEIVGAIPEADGELSYKFGAVVLDKLEGSDPAYSWWNKGPDGYRVHDAT